MIRSGELAYYRVEEEELSAALNIIHLSPGSVAISAEDDNTFTIATTKESHRYHNAYPSCIYAALVESLRAAGFEVL